MSAPHQSASGNASARRRALAPSPSARWYVTPTPSANPATPATLSRRCRRITMWWPSLRPLEWGRGRPAPGRRARRWRGLVEAASRGGRCIALLTTEIARGLGPRTRSDATRSVLGRPLLVGVTPSETLGRSDCRPRAALAPIASSRSRRSPRRAAASTTAALVRSPSLRMIWRRPRPAGPATRTRRTTTPRPEAAATGPRRRRRR
mmetsp:Transcript_46945/g.102073  ORF Transcript_46945/g.102073 Transcript_46945/m.102073 type:complete len:206 (+) Transcript_46945:643-1260(+)